MLFAPLIAFGILGVIGIRYPQLFGNGLDMARDAFLGLSGFGLMLTLFALKPLVTALCLGSGHPADCSPRRSALARSSAAHSASHGTWPGPGLRPARSPWSARPL